MAKEGEKVSEKKEASKTKKHTVKKPKKTTSTKKETPVKIETHVPQREENIQKMLIENFVGLQSVLANLSSKINDLTEKVSSLLGLFEESANALMKNEGGVLGMNQNKEVSEKLSKLLDQNKILAQGISLLHEPAPEQHEEYPENAQEQQMQGPPQGMPMNSPQNKGQQGNYQKSISSNY